jgi:uncharacterized protein (TIGR02996 family)
MNDAMLEAMMKELGEKPRDVATWCAIADYLEENGEESRAELARLGRRMRLETESWTVGDSERVQELLAQGVSPVVPTVVNSIGMRFAWIVTDPVEFWMGADASVDEEADENESPRHKVRLTRPFALGIHPVTQAQYERIMGKNPSYFSASGPGKDEVRGMDARTFPVEQVSWEDANKFLKKLNDMPEEKKAGRKCRLPSEAEWEYSCRGGVLCEDKYKSYHFGDTLTSEQANFFESGLKRPCKVGSYPENAFGVHDMHGNVWEWCEDWYGEYPNKEETDPTGPKDGSYRVIRGGSWYDLAWYCRSAGRNDGTPTDRSSVIGFRVACSFALPAKD